MAISDIEKALRTDSLIIGYKQVVRALQSGLLKEVLVSGNGKDFIDGLKLVAGKIPVKLMSESSKDLGIMCRKPFSITVLGFLAKEELVSKKEKKIEKKEVKPKKEEKKEVKEKKASKTKAKKADNKK